MNGYLGSLLAVLTGVLIAVVGELLSEEIRDRLDQVPRAILRFTERWLEPDQRVTVYRDEWEPELIYILKGAEARPVTRLVKGTWYALGIFVSVHRITGHLHRPAPGHQGLASADAPGTAAAHRARALQEKGTLPRYLDLLEGSVAALQDFETRKQRLRAVPGSQLSLPAQGALRRGHSNRLYRMQQQAITRLREGDAANPQLIHALADRTFLPFTPDRSLAATALSQDHYEAVSRACAVQDFLLVTSPPGTGSTHVTSEIIDHCVRRGERVLVVGATNAGLESLLSRLPADIAAFHVGKSDPLSYDQAQVVAGTAAGVTLSGIISGHAFDLLVIVEAEQVSLPSVIASLVSVRRVVLIGDPRQLPLFVDSDMVSWLRQLTAGPGENLRAADMEALLTTSLFELLLTEAPVTHKVVLTTQYRMPRAVADFVSRNFYDGMLRSFAAREPLLPSPLPHPFTIVDTSCLSPGDRKEHRSARSYVNPAEASIISAIVTAADGRGQDWAVAVPYAAQAILIREQLRESLGRTGAADDLEVRVGTIDSFSRREHDLVIIGCTRSNKERSVGFLRELRRFNVAMTRARRQLVVVGDMETLTCAQDRPVRELMNAMFEHVRECGEIIGADMVAGRLR